MPRSDLAECDELLYDSFMPELPEVETVKRGLARLLPGLVVKSVDFNWAKSFPNTKGDTNAFLVEAEIKAMRRRAKVLIIDLSTDYSLIVHLKMTGQLVFVGNPELRKSNIENRFGAGHPNDSLIGQLPDKSTRVTITFTSGGKLFFNDQRKFGWVRLLPTNQIDELDFFKKVGPEPLASDFTDKVFIERIRRRANTSIKGALLDQTVLAGVGNIYADESLWAAKIHPATKVKDVSDAALKRLKKELPYSSFPSKKVVRQTEIT